MYLLCKLNVKVKMTKQNAIFFIFIFVSSLHVIHYQEKNKSDLAQEKIQTLVQNYSNKSQKVAKKEIT